MSDLPVSKYFDPHSEKALFGLAVYRRNDEGIWVLRPRLGTIAAAFGVLLAFLYFAAATGMYVLNRYYRECYETSYKEMMFYVIPNRIPFTDIVFLPEFINSHIVLARLSQQAKLGDTVFRNAKTPYEVLLGARLSPRNLQAQVSVAQFFLGRRINRIDHAFDILDNTLPYGLRDSSLILIEATKSQELFISVYTRLCFAFNQDNRIILAAEKYLETTDIGPSTKTSLALSYAEACFLRGEFEKAVTILDKYNLLKTLHGYLLYAQILWENGERERALTVIKTANQNKSNPEINVRLLYMLAKFYYEENRLDEAASALSNIIIYKPNDYKARIAMLALLKGGQNKARKDEITETLLKQFSADERAMLTLGAYAADQGDIELQRQISKVAFDPTNRFKRLANFRLLVVETLLSAGKNTAALGEIADLFAQNPTWLKGQDLSRQFEVLRMLAYFADKQNDLGKITFNKIADSSDIPIEWQVLVARRLLTLGRQEEAKTLLTNAYLSNNQNADVLLELVKIDLAGDGTAELSEHLGHLVNSRRPPRYVIENAYKKLAGDRFIFIRDREKLINDLAEMLRTRNLPKKEIERKSYLPY